MSKPAQYITDNPIWTDKVRQIDPSDRVLGGTGEPANWQAEDLANRTAFLKQWNEKQDVKFEVFDQRISNASATANAANANANGRVSKDDVLIERNASKTKVVSGYLLDLIEQALLSKMSLSDTELAALKKSVEDHLKNHPQILPIAEGGTGATTAVNARKNLGLGSSATLDKTDNFGTSSNLVATQLLVDKLQKEMFDAIPVGVIVSWDHDVAPKNWLFVRDQKFSATEYPELAKLYPNLTLNDRRGTVDRALDAGRGFDAGRVLGSYQEDAMQPIRGSAGDIYGGPSPESTGAIYGPNNTSGTLETSSGRGRSVWGLDFDSSRVTRTANETRMKNIATNKIIKAK